MSAEGSHEPHGGDAQASKVLETAEDIAHRRNEVLERYEKFKQATRERRDRLEEARAYQLFKRNADELETWLLEKLQLAGDEAWRDATNLLGKIQKHEALEAECTAHAHTLNELKKSGEELITRQHYAADTIRARLDELDRLWRMLLERLAERGKRLQQVSSLYCSLGLPLKCTCSSSHP